MVPCELVFIMIFTSYNCLMPVKWCRHVTCVSPCVCDSIDVCMPDILHINFAWVCHVLGYTSDFAFSPLHLYLFFHFGRFTHSPAIMLQNSTRSITQCHAGVVSRLSFPKARLPENLLIYRPITQPALYIHSRALLHPSIGINVISAQSCLLFIDPM